MMDDNSTERGNARGTRTALWNQINSSNIPVLTPFPTKSSTHSQKNCMIRTISVMKKVAINGPIKAFTTRMSNFFGSTLIGNE
jgi:hypothetical protein